MNTYPVQPLLHQGSRISASVGGEEIFFETVDAGITAAPEAFAGAFLEPALELSFDLEFDDPLDPVWLEGTRKIPETYQRWWKYEARYPIQATKSQVSVGRSPGVGACFTGGVDSFYTQLRAPNASRITHLVYVHGYDIPLADSARMTSFEPSLRSIARELGRTSIVVRSNLRTHPIFAAANWERSHGGALAAAGHLLSNVIGTLIIPSSHALGDSVPWGSHFDTDPLHSSSRVTIVHDDATLHRRAKLRAIAHEPIVRKHLRVCWENRSSAGNCSMCEKCIRTMIILAGVDELQNYPVFDQSVPLPARIDAVPFVSSHLLYVYQALLGDNLPRDVHQAIEQLLDRSSRPTSFPRRVARKLRRLFSG